MRMMLVYAVVTFSGCCIHMTVETQLLEIKSCGLLLHLTQRPETSGAFHFVQHIPCYTMLLLCLDACWDPGLLCRCLCLASASNALPWAQLVPVS